MKQLLVGVIAAFLSITVHADAMTLEKRQADATMNMTSLALWPSVKTSGEPCSE